jgi:hypothetical protein
MRISRREESAPRSAIYLSAGIKKSRNEMGLMRENGWMDDAMDGKTMRWMREIDVRECMYAVLDEESGYVYRDGG